jgi:hypothetical protein
MKDPAHYGTVTEALSEFRKQGYTLDFNLDENCIVCNLDRFDADEFEIVDMYRYEGESDPADEAVIYAIHSHNGLKGVLVTGYGTSMDNVTERILKKLSFGKQS